VGGGYAAAHITPPRFSVIPNKVRNPLAKGDGIAGQARNPIAV